MRKWNGKYYVTIRLESGKITRRDAARPLPKGTFSVIATDNGMARN